MEEAKWFENPKLLLALQNLNAREAAQLMLLEAGGKDGAELWAYEDGQSFIDAKRVYNLLLDGESGRFVDTLSFMWGNREETLPHILGVRLLSHVMGFVNEVERHAPAEQLVRVGPPPVDSDKMVPTIANRFIYALTWALGQSLPDPSEA